jgi:EAL domain-containing protein (putative c-di-GMP-specific phosphodiesterase class I)
MIDEYLENSDEKLLVADVERIRRMDSRQAFYGCYIALDRTAWFAQRKDAFDTLAQTVAKVAFDSQGKSFKLHTFDICLILRVETVRLFERIEVRLASVLQNIFPTIGLMGVSIETMVTWYPLETQITEFATRVQGVANVLEEFINRRTRLLRKATKTGGGDTEMGAFDPTILAEIERAISRANVDSFIRNQPVCALKAGSLPVPIFREVYISLDQLRRQFAPTIDLQSTPALFHHLARTLDQRLLRAIIGGYIGPNFGPFSINLTIQTILSPLFREFDERVNQFAGRNQLIVEIQRYDVFWDYTEFKIACEFLRSNGYRILLDGITPNVLQLFTSMDIGADFIKMFVHRDDMDDWLRPEIAKLIADNAGIIINGRCGTEQEGRIAADAGIEMFQGWAVDEAIRNKQPAGFISG